MIEIVYQPEKISEDKLHELIASSGYDTERKKGDDKAYNNLPGCCQYERKKIICTAMNFKLLIVTLLICYSGFAQDAIRIASSGQKPNVTIDKDGIIRIVYGNEKTLYYIESCDKGKTFSEQVKVCTFTNNIVLAMGRGPQIASANGNTVISCIDNKGNVYTVRKDARSKKWSDPVQVNNDAPGKALEGFCSSVASGKEFYLLWHDLRSGQNELYGSVSFDEGKKWNPNTVIYSSSDTSKSICPCCKSSLTVDNKGKVYAMWRNQMNGSRDLYLQPFDRSAEAQKLGLGTWQMNSCPMDGGSMSTNSDGQITTIWRRQNSIYTCEPGKEEVQIGDGRNPVIAAGSIGNFIAYQKYGSIYIITPNEKAPIVIGKGDFPKIAVTTSNQLIVIWEGENGEINFKIIV